MPLCVFTKFPYCPNNEVYIFQKAVHCQSSQSNCHRFESPRTRKSVMATTPSIMQAYTMRISSSTVKMRSTACGWSSASTSIACFAIIACLAVANGIRTILCCNCKIYWSYTRESELLTPCATKSGRWTWLYRSILYLCNLISSTLSHSHSISIS